MKDKTRILFIGNSYTYYNDMPLSLFGPMAKAAGYDVEIVSVTKGGYTLEQFENQNDEKGKEAERVLSEKQFDFVVIQEQSVRPASYPDKFFASVRYFAERIRKNGAEPILYSTWGRKTGHSTLTENGWTNETMTRKLAAAYEEAGKREKIKVAYSGLAFFDVYTNHPEIELYNNDLTHPSYAGSWLAAKTIFCTAFNADPDASDFYGELKKEDAAILSEAAGKAVFNTPEIPEKYKIFN